jgi:two-component system cell cycle sensor histidine kinase/response regulator CckA
MILLRSVVLNAVIVFAASAARLVAAPSGNAFPVVVPPWVVVFFLLIISAAGGCLWQVLNTMRRPGRSSRTAGLPAEDTLNAVIVRESSDALFTINAAGLIQSLNPAARQQFGYTIEEIRDKSISALIPPPARGRQRANYMANPGTRELFGVRRDGSRFPIDVKLDELTFANGSLMAVSVRDVSARYAAEREVERRLAASEAIVHQTGAPLFVLSRDGKIERMNRASEMLLDFSSGEVKGQAIWEIVAMPERAEELQSQMEGLLRGTFPARSEMVFTARDGREYTMSCVFTATLDEFGVIETVILTAHDISSRKALESSHLRTERLAAVSRLAGGVAHDFNNLLTAITGYSGMALQNLDSGNPIRKDLEQIKRAGDRGAAITRQLLALSGRHPRQPRLLHLHDSVKSAERMLRVLAGEAIHLEIHTDPALPRIEADAAQVEEVLLHLAAFLCERMSKGGRLTIRTQPERLERDNCDSEPPVRAGEYASVTLSDTSQPLSREAVAHLFEPFFPARETLRSNGLGLAMVAGLVKQNGGAILVTAKPGGGNVICVYWPKAAAQTLVAGERPGPLFMVPKPVVLEGTETILVAMANAEERARVRAMLVPAGYTVIAARSGLQALEMAHKQEGTLHAVVTDITLPDMSGADLIMAIRHAQPGVRSIYVTSRPSVEILEQGLSLGSVMSLQETTEPRELLERVRAALTNRSMSVGR